MARGRKATPIAEKLANLADLQVQFLEGKTESEVTSYNSKSDEKKLSTLTAYKFRMSKANESTKTNQELESIEAANALFKAIKKDATALSEKELDKLYSKLDSVKSFVNNTKAEAKAKIIAAKKDALQALKKEIEELEKD